MRRHKRTAEPAEDWPNTGNGQNNISDMAKRHVRAGWSQGVGKVTESKSSLGQRRGNR